MKNKSNITKYKVLSKFYDRVFRGLLSKGRRKSLSLIDFDKNDKVLLIGVGTGLDIPFIAHYNKLIGVDLSESMLTVAKKKYDSENIKFIQMNVENLSFEDSEFDIVIISLVLSVVENPEKALDEALRVVKKSGKILIYDKFSEHDASLMRKLLNKITSIIGTDINRSFQLISRGKAITIDKDIPVMFGDNYRGIVLSKLDE